MFYVLILAFHPHLNLRKIIVQRTFIKAFIRTINND